MKGLRIDEQVLGAKNLQLAMTYSNLCMFYIKKGDYIRAQEFHSKAFQIQALP